MRKIPEGKDDGDSGKAIWKARDGHTPEWRRRRRLAGKVGLFPGPVCRARVSACARMRVCKRRGQCADVGSRMVARCHLASRAIRKHMGVLSPGCVCFHLIRGSRRVVCLRITVESADSTANLYPPQPASGTFVHSGSNWTNHCFINEFNVN